MSKQDKSGWRIRTNNRSLNTPDGHGPHKLRFVEGQIETENEVAANHAADICGYEVTDLKSGKVRNPLKPSKAEREAAAMAALEAAEAAEKKPAEKK